MAIAERPTEKLLAAKRILVVEDDRDIQDALSVTLREEGFDVTVALSGEDALARLRQDASVDLIVLDLVLPGMSGWQFRSAQRSQAAISAIPVIAMSADRRAEAQAIHADYYLPKPFTSETLLAAVHQVFLGQECRRLEKRLRESERLVLLGTVAAGVGHEINNPLTYILANVDMLEKTLPELEPQQILSRLREVRHGAERIRSVVAALRDMSRRPDEQRQLMELRAVLERSIAMAGPEVRSRARLHQDLVGAPAIVGNEPRLGQVFINLLINAAQAFDSGVPETNDVSVRARTVATDAIVEISDSGRGIAPDLQERIFEPFFTTKEPGRGTGLGLAISRDIVAEHGGRIEVESAPGRGSTFRVVLPLQRPATRPPAPGNARGGQSKDRA
jgi:signal transduction histidine kinase